MSAHSVFCHRSRKPERGARTKLGANEGRTRRPCRVFHDLARSTCQPLLVWFPVAQADRQLLCSVPEPGALVVDVEARPIGN